MTGSDFVGGFVSSVRKQDGGVSIDNLRQKLMRSHFLVIDGVHFLCGKTKTQDFLFSVLENMEREVDKRVVFTSVLPPEKFGGFSEELRSRIIQGWRAELSFPDLETRRQLIMALAEKEHCFLDHETVNILSAMGKGEIRQIKSFLENIKVRRQINPSLSSREIVDEVTHLYVSSKGISLERILGEVSTVFKIEVEVLKGKSSEKTVSLPRQIYFHLARQLTDESVESIGQMVNRSHSSVLYGADAFSKALKRDHSLQTKVQFLEEKLK